MAGPLGHSQGITCSREAELLSPPPCSCHSVQPLPPSCLCTLLLHTVQHKCAQTHLPPHSHTSAHTRTLTAGTQVHTHTTPTEPCAHSGNTRLPSPAHPCTQHTHVHLQGHTHAHQADCEYDSGVSATPLWSESCSTQPSVRNVAGSPVGQGSSHLNCAQAGLHLAPTSDAQAAARKMMWGPSGPVAPGEEVGES